VNVSYDADAYGDKFRHKKSAKNILKWKLTLFKAMTSTASKWL